MIKDFVQAVHDFTRWELGLSDNSDISTGEDAEVQSPGPSSPPIVQVGKTNVSGVSDKLSVWEGWPCPDRRERDE